MTTAVERGTEVYLGGHRFRTIGGMQSQLASVYPAKVTFGDNTRDSQPRASVLALSDWRSGIGLDKSEEAASVDRAWWSTLSLRHRNNLVLPFLTTQTAAAGSGTVGILIDYEDEIYGTFGAEVYSYDNATNSWGSVLHTLPAAATDAVVARVEGTVLLFIAHTTGYTYFDGTTWTDDTENMIYVAWWDNKIWGVDEVGQLRFSTWITPGSWTDDAQLPLPDGYATDLFTGEDAGNNSILYAATKIGLWAHDFANTKFVQTKLTGPLHPRFGNGSTRWRDAIYMPVGNGIYRYLDGVGTAVISVMGPDRDDGLPADKRGVIRQLVASHNELLAILDGTTAPVGTVDMFASGESPVIDPDAGFSSILGWDENGWQVLWLGEEQATAISRATIANAYSEYRLWWGQGSTVYFMDLPTDITNPEQLTDAEYATSGELETPWFNMGQDEVSKLALELDLVMSDVTATDTITISYALNLNETYTELKEFDKQPTDGHSRLLLPTVNNHVGIPFQWIRFKVELGRGVRVTATPILHSLTLTFRKKLPVREGFSFRIDMTKEYEGLSPKQQREAILDLLEQEKLVEFTYRSDDITSDRLRKYFVDIVSVSFIEETGLEEKKLAQLTVAEV